MPAPRDLTDVQFGRLTVLRRGPHVTYGGKSQWSWLAECTCGRQETLPQSRLTSGRADRCSYCAQPRCDECGDLFERTGPTQYYCVACQPIVRQRRQREHYYRRAASDPEFNRRRAAIAASRVNDEVRARRRAASRRRAERVKQDPERLDRQREYAREWKRAWMELLRLDPQEYALWRAARNERTREYQRQWKSNWRKKLTREQTAELRARQREWRRQAALNELLQIVSKSNNRDNQNQ